MRSLSTGNFANLEHNHDLELTWASNAIDGNALSLDEAALVIEEGVTVGGKPLKDHLELLDEYDAIRFVRDLARESRPLTEPDIRNLHTVATRRSTPDAAGHYADHTRYLRIEGRTHVFPRPAKVPSLMREFGAWLSSSPDTPETAFAAHLRLLNIHPFNHGNGRLARLVMNLILARGGFPPIAVRPQHREEYVRGWQQAQAGQGADAFNRLMSERLDATLSGYLNALQETARHRPEI